MSMGNHGDYIIIDKDQHGQPNTAISGKHLKKPDQLLKNYQLFIGNVDYMELLGTYLSLSLLNSSEIMMTFICC